MRAGRTIGSWGIFVAGLQATTLADHPGSKTGGAFIPYTTHEVQQIVHETQRNGFTLLDALLKGQAACDGMPISARGRLVQPREYARVMRVNHDIIDQDGKTMLFEVACAPRDRRGDIEAMAVLPESGDIVPLRGAGPGFRTVSQRENPYQDFDSDTLARPRSFSGESERLGKSQHLCKASKIIGAEVVNFENEELGEIEDIAIDSRSGKVKYLVLDTAGRLDTTDDYFAIPIQAFSPGGPGELVLNIPAEELQFAEGFSGHDWPTSADPRLERLAMKSAHDDFFETRTGKEATLTTLVGLNPAKARRVAKGLFENNFTLTDAVRYVEGRENCHAIAACAKQMTESGGGQDGNLFVEVACHRSDEPDCLKLVCVSPRTGNIVRTREVTLSDAYGSR